MSENTIREYEDEFAKLFGSGRAFSFWKGRVALYAILKSLGVGKGDEVILPGYTCVANATPIKYLGAKPIYVDIEPETFNIDVNQLDSKITSRTRVIIAQHTYGYLADMDAILKIAACRGVEVIEDSCLALGSRYKGKLAGTFTKAAYFSSQWNKCYTTGIGGMALLNEAELAGKMRQLCESELRNVPFLKTLMLAMQLAVYRAVIYPRTTALAQNTFRWLTNKGLVLGSSSAEETESTAMSDNFFMQMGSVQAWSGLHQLKKLRQNIEHRRQTVKLYDELLAKRGWRVTKVAEDTEPVLVRYPVRITEKWKAIEEAAKSGVELGAWFESVLHSRQTRVELFDYEWGMCPEGEKACRQVVNLPLHPKVSEKTARRTVEFICRFKQAN